VEYTISRASEWPFDDIFLSKVGLSRPWIAEATVWKFCHHSQRYESCGESGRPLHDRIVQSKSQAFVNRDDCCASDELYVSDAINVARYCWEQSVIAACEVYSLLTNENLQDTIVCWFGGARNERARQNTEAQGRTRGKRFAFEMHSASYLPSAPAHLLGHRFEFIA